eukprot:m.17887 g.17887  ORF g.17887 m.17887 type:complete len:124 (+) comp4852_c0_seq1:173-544(+)
MKVQEQEQRQDRELDLEQEEGEEQGEEQRHQEQEDHQDIVQNQELFQRFFQGRYSCTRCKERFGHTQYFQTIKRSGLIVKQFFCTPKCLLVTAVTEVIRRNLGGRAIQVGGEEEGGATSQYQL